MNRLPPTYRSIVHSAARFRDNARRGWSPHSITDKIPSARFGLLTTPAAAAARQPALNAIKTRLYIPRHGATRGPSPLITPPIDHTRLLHTTAPQYRRAPTCRDWLVWTAFIHHKKYTETEKAAAYLHSRPSKMNVNILCVPKQATVRLRTRQYHI